MEYYFPSDKEARGTVVLFTGVCKGTVVYCPTGLYEVGHYSGSWVNATEADSWTTYQGEVILKND